MLLPLNSESLNTFNYDVCIHLRGLKGSISDIETNQNQVSIIKASYEIAKFYSIAYFVNKMHGIEMFEGDYLLKIKFQVPKSNYRLGKPRKTKFNGATNY